jgi:hypothetical protein
MNAKTLAQRMGGALLAAGLGLAATTQVTDVLAKPKDAAVAADPPVSKKAIAMTLTTVAYGMSPSQLADRIDKVFDEDYKPLFKEVQPGVKMKELEDQLAEDKSAFRRSRIDFGKLPTGLDSSALRFEYTYNNKEALLSLSRKGDTTYFFFIQEQLWKIIEEKKLSDGSPLGKTYQDAVVKMSANFGVPGRVLTPDGTSRLAVEVDWKDSSTHLRAIQRNDTAMGLAYEDNGTLARLSSLRTNKPAADNGVDPDVAAALRGPSKDPGPPEDKKKKK